MVPFILSLIDISCLVPFAEKKQVRSIMFRPLCFKVGMRHNSESPYQTQWMAFTPKLSTLVSSDLMTFSESSSMSCKCSLENFGQACTVRLVLGCLLFSKSLHARSQVVGPPETLHGGRLLMMWCFSHFLIIK